MSRIDNTEQHEQWNGDSGERWVRDADRRDEVLAPIGDALLAAARPRRGEKVLDIGCGCGATTLAAGAAVGPEGAVTGIDLSVPMLDLARERRDVAQATHVDFVDGDAQAYAFSPTHDLAISRFGTMFFGEPTAAFANIGAALQPGGRVCLATWQPLIANDWLTIPGAALLQYGTMPATVGDAGPGMFAQSEPDVVVTVLTDAGYRDVGLEPVKVDLRLGADPAEATDYLAESGVGRTVLETVPNDDRPAALDAVRSLLAGHADHRGVHLGAAIWLITATRPPS